MQDIDVSISTPKVIDVELELGTVINKGGGGDIGGIYFNDEEQIPDEDNVYHLKEKDPTVPEWAKSEYKPKYEAHEIEAVGVNDTLSFETIDNLFSAVFGK